MRWQAGVYAKLKWSRRLKNTAGDDSFALGGVDASASRFHGASVAGLVVGAMGCFIFGLYLRRWMRVRKALASEPQQDMIA